MVDFRVIDYDHTRAGVLCNGVVSDLDGKYEAVWTYDLNGQLATKAEAVSEVAFRGLWNQIQASVASRGVFWDCLVSDPTRLMDPEADHVIVAASELNGRSKSMTFLVPAETVDPEFVRWLDDLAAPIASPPAMAA